MAIRRILGVFCIISVLFSFVIFTTQSLGANRMQPTTETFAFWFRLLRKSNMEYLYYGLPGQAQSSILITSFSVKTGIAGMRPTPLPILLGREYWIITSKVSAEDNPDTSPYFLTLDVPVSDKPPFGPVPYNECHGQCDWVVPGNFGLHGVGGDREKLSVTNAGSSGCIRHSDNDITFLYRILHPETMEIRYYIQDV